MDATDLRDESNVIKVSVVKQVTPIYRTFAPPIIDGTVDAAWNDPEIKSFDAKTAILGGPFDAENFSGSAKVMWDDIFVYVLAQVKDDLLIRDSANNYQDDAVEFYFDGNNGKTTSYQAGNDVQFTFRWDDDVIGANNNIPVTGIVKSMIANPEGDDIY